VTVTVTGPVELGLRVSLTASSSEAFWMTNAVAFGSPTVMVRPRSGLPTIGLLPSGPADASTSRGSPPAGGSLVKVLHAAASSGSATNASGTRGDRGQIMRVS